MATGPKMISSCHRKLLATSFQIQIRNQLCFFLSIPHNVLSICFPPSVAQKPIWCNCSVFWVQCHHKMATNAKWNKETNPNEISQKLSTIQCLFLFKLFLWKCRISPFWSPWKGRGWNAYDMAFTTIFATTWISFMFPFMYPGKCLGLWTYNLRSVHVDLDT